VDPEAEALYGLPLEEFTKARDALARATAKDGNKEGGAAITALRKPSVAAWALNQLARRHPDDVSALLAAGDRLRRAQTAALEGGDPAELREASRAEGAEVQALAGQAWSILADAGRGGSPTQEERLATTLRAAAVDPEAGDLLRRGVLTAELSAAGFGFGMGDEGDGSALPSDFRATKRNSRPATHESQRGERERAREEEKAERAGARERERQRRAELREAEAEANRLNREADEAEKHAAAARKAADQAAARVEALQE
jgi:hypothetical protein